MGTPSGIIQVKTNKSLQQGRLWFLYHRILCFIAVYLFFPYYIISQVTKQTVTQVILGASIDVNVPIDHIYICQQFCWKLSIVDEFWRPCSKIRILMLLLTSWENEFLILTWNYIWPTVHTKWPYRNQFYCNNICMWIIDLDWYP
jgi:predicted neutral ceramidase superfamily lipid hydrolase